MGNRVSKYRDDIIRLRAEGKTLKQISETLSCPRSMVWYHLGYDKILQDRRKEESYKPKKRNKPYKQDNKKRNREIVKKHLEANPCVDCGYSNILALDFDHVRGEKLNNISHAVRDAWPVEKLMAEINKCEIRCSNCHRIITHERRNKNKIKPNN